MVRGGDGEHERAEQMAREEAVSVNGNGRKLTLPLTSSPSAVAGNWPETKIWPAALTA